MCDKSEEKNVWRYDPKGVLSLIRKAETVVDQVKGLIDRLEKDGEIMIEVRVKLPKLRAE